MATTKRKTAKRAPARASSTTEKRPPARGRVPADDPLLYDANPFLDQMIRRRLEYAETIANTPPPLPAPSLAITFPVMVAAGEFLVGAISATNTAANEAAMRDALDKIQKGIAAISAKLDNVLAELDQIVDLLVNLLPQIEHIVDASNLRQTINEYLGLAKGPTQRLQLYFSDPVVAAQHIAETDAALRELENSVNVIVQSAGPSGNCTIDSFLFICPAFGTWVNSWAIAERVRAAADSNYVITPTSRNPFYVDTCKWIGSFFDNCQKTLEFANAYISTTECPGHGVHEQEYSFDGFVFTKPTTARQNRFRREDVYIRCALSISQKDELSPDPTHPRYFWRNSVEISATGSISANKELTNPQLGLDAYGAWVRTSDKIRRCYASINEINQTPAVRKDVENALASVIK